MTELRRCSGFSLIEVLIVVVIMAILAATIIPLFSSSTKDARTSTVMINVQALRSPIELYRAEHLTTYPTITNNTLPQLTSATDVNGNVGTGAAFTYGPYIDAVPINPFNGLATIGPVSTPGTPPATGDGQYGYEYDATTGNIYPDHVGWTYSP
jgi:prepilin-type N-terminal cleavage/methylation domain-containing protein